MSGRALRVLAVDPGREKCGLAVVDDSSGVLARGIVPSELIGEVARSWAAAHRPRLLLLGGGTSARGVRPALEKIGLPLEVIPEGHTTLRARVRYFEENPPRGWRRLIPRGLLVPPEPIDDYAAVLIAEAFFSLGRDAGTQS